jgi:hypothetical protein
VRVTISVRGSWRRPGDLKLVMETMGQIGVDTAMKYQHPDHERARDALNRSNAAAASRKY